MLLLLLLIMMMMMMMMMMTMIMMMMMIMIMIMIMIMMMWRWRWWWWWWWWWWSWSWSWSWSCWWSWWWRKAYYLNLFIWNMSGENTLNFYLGIWYTVCVVRSAGLKNLMSPNVPLLIIDYFYLLLPYFVCWLTYRLLNCRCRHIFVTLGWNGGLLPICTHSTTLKRVVEWVALIRFLFGMWHY